jgi:PAS domain S-box-containing protein
LERDQMQATAAMQTDERTPAELAALHLAAIVESSDDAIVSKDLNGYVTSWNRAAEQLFGYTADEIIGQSILKIIPDDRRSEEDYVLSRVRAGHVVRHFDTVRRRKDGTFVEISLTVSPVKNHAGEIVGASKIARDITERRRFEELLRRTIEYEREAHRVELEDQNRRMQEARRLKTEFAANMSHELRTPLNAIIGFAELMHAGKLGALTSQQEDYLRIILTSSRHLLRLIDDVLDLAKLESGRIELHPEPVDAGSIVREVCDIVRGLAAERQIVLAIDIEEAPDDVVIDAAKLKQVLYNLLSNAIKFTPAGGSVNVGLHPDGPAHFCIVVSDTGIGIKQEDLGRLFVEFQQLDAGLTKRYGGTGLGLALTRRILEAQQGTISVTSHVGAGSTFSVRLPRQSPTAAEGDSGHRRPTGAEGVSR